MCSVARQPLPSYIHIAALTLLETGNSKDSRAASRRSPQQSIGLVSMPRELTALAMDVVIRPRKYKMLLANVL